MVHVHVFFTCLLKCKYWKCFYRWLPILAYSINVTDKLALVIPLYNSRMLCHWGSCTLRYDGIKLPTNLVSRWLNAKYKNYTLSKCQHMTLSSFYNVQHRNVTLYFNICTYRGQLKLTETVGIVEPGISGYMYM